MIAELRGEVGELRGEVRGLGAELREVEERLTYPIADAASRVANVVVERFAEMIKPVDDEASHAVDEAREARAELDRHLK